MRHFKLQTALLSCPFGGLWTHHLSVEKRSWWIYWGTLFIICEGHRALSSMWFPGHNRQGAAQGHRACGWFRSLKSAGFECHILVYTARQPAFPTCHWAEQILVRIALCRWTDVFLFPWPTQLLSTAASPDPSKGDVRFLKAQNQGNLCFAFDSVVEPSLYILIKSSSLILSCSEMADTNDAEVQCLWGGEAEMTHPGKRAWRSRCCVRAENPKVANLLHLNADFHLSDRIIFRPVGKVSYGKA